MGSINKKTNNIVSKILSTTLVFLLSFPVNTIRAEDEAPIPEGLEVSPATMGAYNANLMANLFSGCVNVAAVLDANCMALEAAGAGDSFFDVDTQSCARFVVRGEINMELINKLAMDATKALEAKKCKQKKIKELEAQIACLSNKATQFASTLNDMKKIYTDALAQDAKVVMEVDLHVKMREDQFNRAMEHLHGSEGQGRGGLIKLEQEVDAFIHGPQGMTTQTDVTEYRQKETKKHWEIWQETKQTEKMARAAQCFKTQSLTTLYGKKTDPKTGRLIYTCEVDGGPVTAYQYIDCRYRQSLQSSRKEKGDSKLYRNIKNRRAKGSSEAISTDLATLFSELPLPIENIPSTQLNGDTNAMQNVDAAIEKQQSAKVKTFEALLNRFLSKLGSYDEALPVSGFVKKVLETCYNREKQGVEKDIRFKNWEEKIRQNELETQKMVRNATQAYSNEYTRMMREFLGKDAKVEQLDACNTRNPATQISCMKNFKDEFYALQNKKLQNITIPGKDPNNFNDPNRINITCFGVKGCITELQNYVASDGPIRSDIKRYTEYKQRFIQQANSNVDSFTKQLENMMKIQSVDMSQNLEAINAALGKLGVPGVQLGTLQCEQLQKPEDREGNVGLYAPPQSMKNLIGGCIDPPALDVQPGSFSDTQANLGQASRQFSADIAKLEMKLTDIKGLQARCAEEVVAVQRQDLRDLIDQFQAGSCAYSREMCDQKDAPDQLVGDLANILAALDEGDGLEGSDIFSLRSGIEGLCAAPRKDASAIANLCFNDVFGSYSSCFTDQVVDSDFLWSNKGRVSTFLKKKPDTSFLCPEVMGLLNACGKAEAPEAATNCSAISSMMGDKMETIIRAKKSAQSEADEF